MGNKSERKLRMMVAINLQWDWKECSQNEIEKKSKTKFKLNLK